MIPKNKNNNNQGVFLEMLVAAKNEFLNYVAQWSLNMEPVVSPARPFGIASW